MDVCVKALHSNVRLTEKLQTVCIQADRFNQGRWTVGKYAVLYRNYCIYLIPTPAKEQRFVIINGICHPYAWAYTHVAFNVYAEI